MIRKNIDFTYILIITWQSHHSIRFHNSIKWMLKKIPPLLISKTNESELSFQLISCHFGLLIFCAIRQPGFSHPFYDITTNKGMYVRVRGETKLVQLHAVVLLLTPPIWKLWGSCSLCSRNEKVTKVSAGPKFSHFPTETYLVVVKYQKFPKSIERNWGFWIIFDLADFLNIFDIYYIDGALEMIV